MTSQDLGSQYQFVPPEQWVEVGPFIVGQVSKDEMAKGSLPTGTVVCAMRFCGDPALLKDIGCGLPRGKSDLLYVGYSTKLGVEQAERLYNMRYNHQSTNAHIREGMGKIYGQLSGRVKIGWRYCKDIEEAQRLVKQIKDDFGDDHGQRPPWNR